MGAITREGLLASRTQVALTPERVAELVRAALGGGARVVASEPLRGGTFNACWGVKLAGGAKAVLKVAPPPELPLLRYEQDLLRAEADFYARVGAAGVPVPTVLYADFGRRLVSSDWLLATKLPGASLHAVRHRLLPAERAALRRALGRAAARIGTVRGERFGYPAKGTGTVAASWRESFAAMFGILLEDAERFRVRQHVAGRRRDSGYVERTVLEILEMEVRERAAREGAVCEAEVGRRTDQYGVCGGRKRENGQIPSPDANTPPSSRTTAKRVVKKAV